MSPRPRTATDDQILAAVDRAVARVGPARLTLAEVGRACGLSAGALVQRFGSRRGLLLAHAARGTAVAQAAFRAARAATGSPLGALVDALAAGVEGDPAPAALANRLALPQMEMGDGEFHAHALTRAREANAEIRRMLDAAVAAGELAPCDTAGLARTVQTTWTGAFATWTVFREGTADDWLRDELEAVLAPYLV